jgi:hypothetical protein
MNASVKRLIHILGVACAFAAGAILIVAGVIAAADSSADAIAPGKLITFGLAGLVGAIIATLDGARAFPQLGLWKIGAKFEGLGDLAVLSIMLVFGAAIGVSFAFS